LGEAVPQAAPPPEDAAAYWRGGYDAVKEESDLKE